MGCKRGEKAMKIVSDNCQCSSCTEKILLPRVCLDYNNSKPGEKASENRKKGNTNSYSSRKMPLEKNKATARKSYVVIS